VSKKLAGLSILVVDDETDLAELMAMEFKYLKATVYVAQSGQQALALCLKNQIDFVISDVRMPDGDGLFLTKELRRRNKDVPPILLVSGFSDYSKDVILEAGAIGLLSKPVDLDQVQSIIVGCMNPL
jgi:DNA-binding response OmpR family regulator